MIALFPPVLLLMASVVPGAVQRDVMITGFDRVRVDGAYDVRIRTGKPTVARVRGDADSSVLLSVDGRTLTVRPRRDDRGRAMSGAGGPVTVELSTQAVTSLGVVGGGMVRVDRLSGPRIDLAITGAGRIEADAVDVDRLSATVIGTGGARLSGRARQARFLLNGAVSIEAAGLQADELFVRSEGTGTGRFAARYTADVTGLGTGGIVVDGSPRCQTRGTAAIRCGPLPPR